MYKGAKNAAADLGCTLTEIYGSQQQGQAQPDDNAENAQIQNAINAHVDGIAMSDHDPSLMNPTLAKAAAARGSRWSCSTPAATTRTSPPAAPSRASASPSSSPARPPAPRFKKLGRHQRPVRHPPVGPEPARPLQRHRAGPRRRPAVQVRQPAVERAGVHRAHAVHAQRGVQPAAGDRAGHLVPAVPPADQCGDAPQQRDRHGARQRASRQRQDRDVRPPPTSRTSIKAARWRSRSTSSSTCRATCRSCSCTCTRSTKGSSVGGGTTVASGPLLVDKTNVSKVSAAIAAGDD